MNVFDPEDDLENDLKQFLINVPEQFLINVNGEGGSGKSYVIKVLSSHLQQRADNHRVRNPLIRAAPIGVTANNINGFILHSLLRLPVEKSKFQPLNSANLSILQQQFKGIKFLIIDEKSMLSLT